MLFIYFRILKKIGNCIQLHGFSLRLVDLEDYLIAPCTISEIQASIGFSRSGSPEADEDKHLT